jgi:hypothetical protein
VESEENNLVKEPFYMGWPYFAGEKDMGGRKPYDITIPTGSLRSGPINNAAVAGVKTLPPIREPIFKRDQGCAMTGPIFRYDGALANAGQFPPQMDRKWIISGCDATFGFHLMTLDAAGEAIVTDTKIFKNFVPQTLVDLKQGPDGALYYVSWKTGIFRIEYTGSCKDPQLAAEKTGCATEGFENYDPALPKAYNDPRLCKNGSGVAVVLRNAEWLRVGRSSIMVDAPGRHDMRVMDVRGRVVFAAEGAGPMSYDLGALAAPALYQVRVRTAKGTAIRSVSLMGF